MAVVDSERIKRELDGRSLKWLSEKSGMKYDALYRSLNGDRRFLAEEIASIAKVFNLPQEELFTLEPDEEEVPV